MIVALRPASWYRQSGVVPVRWKDGLPQVLLVTSRRGKRWVIPKGVVEEDLSPARSAAKEAWEEAGITGTVSRARIGRYAYEKWGGFCTVTVFLLEVREVLREWPEKASRRRKWFSSEKAAARVAEPELQEIIVSVGKLKPPRGDRS